MLVEKNGQKSFLTWTTAAIAVASLHFGAGYLITKMQGDLNAVMGGPEAIMLEFAEEPTAPDVDEVSETIQQKTDANIPEPQVEKPQEVAEAKPEPIKEPEPEQPLQESEMIEEVKPPEPPKEEVKQEEPKPEPKKEVAKVEETKPKKEVQKANKTQKSTGPQIVAKKAATYAAPATNRKYGNNGRLIDSWQNKVQHKIAIVSKRISKPRNIKRLTAAVHFTFNEKGKILNIKIARSSGDADVDALVIKIVQRTRTIPKPPEGSDNYLIVPVSIQY